MKRLIPRSITTQTLLVLIVGLTVSHVFSVGLYFTDRTSALPFGVGKHLGERIATIERLAENAAPEERRRIVALADTPLFHVTWSRESAIDNQQTDDWRTDALRDALIAHLGDGRRQAFNLRRSVTNAIASWRDHLRQIHQNDEITESLMASLPLSDGSWLNFATPVTSPEPFWSLRFALSLIVMLISVSILSAVVVRHLTKPLGTFVRAARRLGVDVKAPPLAENGPLEVRQAARTFNEMQERIRRFVDDRTQMIAAISHDLGTPITRLRLRAEFIEDEEQQQKMLADLDDMEKMVFSTLSFARDEAASEPRALVDLRSLLHRVCDDVTDAGHSVALTAGDRAIAYGCQPVALRRAFANLIENAVNYGFHATVSLNSNDDRILVRIDDDGPGIPDDLMGEVFKPFRRLDASRSQETGGTGLGLTVARTIIRAHGGDVTLSNRKGGGLRVEIRLPR